MFKSLYKIYLNSKLNIHIITILFAIVFIVLFEKLSITVTATDEFSILTGVSLLSSLFLLAVEKIDFALINDTFTNYVKVRKNKENKESVVIRDTVFSLSLTTFLLIGVCFILKLFNVDYVHVLIIVVCYLFFDILYTIILWNYTLSKKTRNYK